MPLPLIPALHAGPPTGRPAPAPSGPAPRPGDFALIGRQVVEILEIDGLFVSVRFPGESSSVLLLRDALLYPDSLRQG